MLSVPDMYLLFTNRQTFYISLKKSKAKNWLYFIKKNLFEKYRDMKSLRINMYLCKMEDVRNIFILKLSISIYVLESFYQI